MPPLSGRNGLESRQEYYKEMQWLAGVFKLAIFSTSGYLGPSFDELNSPIP
jgi:hypothetical protein